MPTIAKQFKLFLWNRRSLRRPYLHAAYLWHVRKGASRWSDLRVNNVAKPQPETFIFSRFGTETVGNFFIQLGLLRVLFEASPERPVYLLSADPEVTGAGISEILKLLERTPASAPLARFIAEKVFIAEEEKIRCLAPGDLLILGGGPIMDDPEPATWLVWFEWARRSGARIMIAGCGLGPLRSRKAIAIAESLLALADATILRNRPQENFARAARGTLEIALDPAFLCMPLLAPLVGTKKRLLAINARRVGFDSVPDRAVPVDEVVEQSCHHALRLAEWTQFDEVVPFSTKETKNWPDSMVATRVAQSLADELGIQCKAPPETTVLGIVDALLPAEYVLSTRMHGFIIGLMLGCRAANLDYVGSAGKGADFYRDWLERPTAPSLLVPDSLRHEDFVSLSEHSGIRTALDTLLDTYVKAVRKALAG